ncbi:SDR family NAD(P)-dependent oxidoreductase [Pseudolysinimonas yzui]|uniref:2-deoxy-D-gluconate 3-dehydrogenase n=1 Tax=Pseudolysinimonas yzui TaxID=2708254 RepID=A0A8J3GS14_9MICO|nr:SDR family NAD(P)-dependent oxidoreductase [Pseudolysinimonas yzui]GHF23652.1 2-deoxy-D-gluconate 3-dehydrogenase [Pseudolysinimonas yzui]
MKARTRTPLVDQLSFAGKKILVTGAASGIGRAICTRFDEAGATLVMVDSDARGLQATLASLTGAGHDLQVVDLEHKADIDALWTRLGTGSVPDVLVNNAGIYPMRDFLDVDEAYLRRTLDINLNATFWMCQNFIARRGSRGGVIVNTSSVEAILPFKDDMVHYSISKAGVLALTRSLARDYGGKGFRTNVVIPGAITTPGTQALVRNAILRLSFKLAKTGYAFQQRLANRRWGYPDDVAKVVLFLSSDLASYVQGAALPVDGGFLSS